ncbi:hypothetical protein F2Q65_03720 [Thiohalocapsa marina]|uniref:FimV N-terminal domain-containing protein n=1 Tax=Thiohalocapsa marina TaxID=424902 RepID=A0A5M8FT88_9GAMM|nr:FimV/HubP family polar landmark protein [Thiohalocapsa marina]KAA6187008.1 hypothetical protein F2Q65_03720 [Thiohalocapsa marina]
MRGTLTGALLGILLLQWGGAHALGVSALRTRSALNQPFQAEIDLRDISSEELDAVKVRLASAEAFDKAGIDRPYFLTRLAFTATTSAAGQPIIQVSSREPIREPFLDFLLEVIWPDGRLVRQYTVLLDPPDASRPAVPQISQPRLGTAPRQQPPLAVPNAQPLSAQPASDQSSSDRTATALVRKRPVLPPQAATIPFPLEYGPVPRGVGLLRLAQRLVPDGATVEQTTLALYRNNPHAFANGDIDRLKSGARLRIPSAEALFAVDATTAERQLQDVFAGRPLPPVPIPGAVLPPVTPPVPAVAPDSPAAELRIAAAPPPEVAPEAMPEAAPEAQTTAAPESTPEAALELPPRRPAGDDAPGADTAVGEPMADSDQGLLEDLLLLREVSEANRQEAAELRVRVRDLESQLQDIRQLVELRNDQLARLEALVAGDVATPSQAITEPDSRPASDAASQPGSTLAATSEPASEPASEPVAEPALTPPPAAPPAPPAAQGGLLDAVLDFLARLPLWAKLAAVAALAGGLLFNQRRRQQAEAQATEKAAKGGGDKKAPKAGRQQAPEPGAKAPAGAAFERLLQRMRGRLQAFVAALRQRLPGSSRRAAQDRDREPSLAPVGEAAGTVSSLEPELGAADAVVGGAASAATAAIGAPISGPAESDEVLEAGLPPEAPPEETFAVLSGQVETEETDVLAEADIYILYGRYRDAVEVLEQALQLTPARVELKYKLAEALRADGDDVALADLMQRMQADGDDAADPAAWARLGRARDDMGPSGPEAPAFATEEEDLDLDLEALDRLTQQAESGGKPRLQPASPPPVQVGEADLGPDDLSLPELSLPDLNLPDSNPPESNPPESKETALNELTLDEPALNAPDLSLPEPVLPTPGDPGTQPPTGLQAPAVEPASEADSPPEALDLELNLRLDVEPGLSDDSAPSTSQPARPEPASPFATDGDALDAPAMKLDLARAYLEMDDADAARTLLAEVRADGNAEQQAQAQALLEQLG